MYSYIKGLIVDIQSDHIVLENNGIGYLIYVSNPYAFSKGKEVVVFLYQQVKEDGILLYGFNSKSRIETTSPSWFWIRILWLMNQALCLIFYFQLIDTMI